MIGITDEIITDFVDYLFKTTPFKMQIPAANKEGIKNIIKKMIADLYQDIPKDVLDFMGNNASERFLDLIYREAGISDYHIKRVPENLKVRVSYLLNVLNVNKASQAVFKLFHEALEEFYPKMNIYLVEIQSKTLSTDSTELVYKLDPRYITDEDNIIEEISENELSGAFLMRPDQFLDKEEKFSNIYQDYKSKQRIINIFPIKTGILYVQNPTGLGQAHFDTYIPLMQTIGASLQQYNLIPWRMNEDDKKKNIPFVDYIKLCNYLKFKEFEFKAKALYSTTWRWETRPLETYRDAEKLKSWNKALQQAQENGLHWSYYYTYVQTKLNDFLLNAEDLAEAERLEIVYKGLKRSGLYNGRQDLNQFKTDWNTLRQKSVNVSLRKVSNIDEFREELIGQEPLNLLEFELLLLKDFQQVIHGDARNSIYNIKKMYTTNQEDTLDPDLGLVTLVKKFQINMEFNEFIRSVYTDYNKVEKNETKFLLDLLDYYTKLGTTPLLRNYNAIKKLKFPELVNMEIDDEKYLNNSIYKKVYNELSNNTNIVKFQELNNIIKIRYRTIVQYIDDLTANADDKTDVEDYTMIFLYLWKLLQADISTDARVRFFWNEFFMRFIMGSTFKDFFYDPIMDLFLEYWFPAETTTQNKDIQTILIKDKMQTIPLQSVHYNSYDKKLFDTLTFKDQNIITHFNADGSTKEVHKNMFKEALVKDLSIEINY